jgi:hypothetical protein
MMRIAIAALALLSAATAQAGPQVLEVEVLEASAEVVLPGSAASRVRYSILHHKHAGDQALLSEWLRSHASARVSFETADGASHQAVLQRLKHCFGRGLLLYTDPVQLSEKEVVRLQLDALE